MEAALIVYAAFVALALLLVIVVVLIVAIKSLVRLVRRLIGRPVTDSDKPAFRP